MSENTHSSAEFAKWQEGNERPYTSLLKMNEFEAGDKFSYEREKDKTEPATDAIKDLDDKWSLQKNATANFGTSSETRRSSANGNELIDHNSSNHGSKGGVTMEREKK